MGQRLVGLVRACHPEASAAVTTIAALLAIAVGHTPAGVAGVTLTVLASQLCIGWHNDWLDADRDALVERTGKPIPAGLVARRTVGRASVAAGVAMVAVALPLGFVATLVITAGLLGGLAYNWPLKMTLASPAPYLVSFAALAAFVVLALPHGPHPPLWMVSAAALLGGGAHFANVLPDLADDRRTGVRGLPHLLGARGSWAAAAMLLLAAGAVVTIGTAHRAPWIGAVAVAFSAVVLALGWFRSLTPGSRAAFYAALVVALVDVILLLLAPIPLRRS
jgi:protoheme IX farnesyltransferase